MDGSQKTFAGRLSEVREVVGLSQYALAKKAGLSKQALSLLEQGEREPSWDTVQRLAKALGVDCTAFADPELQLPDETLVLPRGRPKRPAAPPTSKAKHRKK